MIMFFFFFFFQAEDGIRDGRVTGVQSVLFRSYRRSRIRRRTAPAHIHLEWWPRFQFLSGACRGIRPKAREDGGRSEERRVGKECRSRWSGDYLKKKVKEMIEN